MHKRCSGKMRDVKEKYEQFVVAYFDEEQQLVSNLLGMISGEEQITCGHASSQFSVISNKVCVKNGKEVAENVTQSVENGKEVAVKNVTQSVENRNEVVENVTKPYY